MRTVVHPQLDVDFSDDESKFSINMNYRKVARSLCNHDIFFLTDHDHGIFVDDTVGRNRIEYNKQHLEYIEQDSD